MQVVIADTGFVVTLAIETDSKHEDCKALYTLYPDILLPQTVLRTSKRPAHARDWRVVERLLWFLFLRLRERIDSPGVLR